MLLCVVLCYVFVGYGESLMKRLAEKHPQSVSQLALQYRMNETISKLSNIIAYDGKLRSAAEVANRRLELPFLQPPNLSGECSDQYRIWLYRVIDPNRPVVLVNTDRFKGGGKGNDDRRELVELERKQGRNKSTVVNDNEVIWTGQILDGLISAGLEPSKIGVISPFRAQVCIVFCCIVFY